MNAVTPKPVGGLSKGSVLFLFMLLPWAWVGLGMYVIRNFKITFVLYYLLGCLMPLLFLRHGPLNWRQINFRKKELFAWIVLGNLFMLSAWVVCNHYFFIWADFIAGLQRIHYVAKKDFYPVALFFLTVNPLIEEVFWRGTLYENLKTLLGVRRAVAVSSFFFGAWHWVIIRQFFYPLPALVITFAIMVGGVFFTLFYEKSRSLMASVLIHSLGADLPILLILYDALKKMHAL